ncbi:MAG: hypothetical protein AB7V53_14540 [Dongiaceae bacterium]
MRRRFGQLAHVQIIILATAMWPLRAPAADSFEPARPIFTAPVELASAEGPARSFGLLLDFGLSDGWGKLRSRVAAQGSFQDVRAVRLESAFVRSLPDLPFAITAGDAVTRGSDWARPQRFGGIMIAPDFDRPRSATAAPTAVGFTGPVIPAIDRAEDVPALLGLQSHGRDGITVDPVTLETGAGLVDFDIEDAFARLQQGLGQPGQPWGRILGEGKSLYFAELGFTRENYGIESFDYGDPMVSGTYRHGITGKLTGEIHAEALPDSQAGGFGLLWNWPGLGRFGLATAASGSDEGTGALARASFEHVAENWRASLSYQRATESFAQPGFEEAGQRVTRRAQLTGGMALGDYGAVSVGYSMLERADASQGEVASFAYAMPFLPSARLVAASDFGAAIPSSSIGFSFSIPLGP